MLRRKWRSVALGILIFVGLLVVSSAGVGILIAEESQAIQKAQISPELGKWLCLAAAACVVGSCLGAGYAVGRVGAAAMGAVAEKPELIGRALIFVGLSEGIAIYGLIIAIMLIGRLP